MNGLDIPCFCGHYQVEHMMAEFASGRQIPYCATCYQSYKFIGESNPVLRSSHAFMGDNLKYLEIESLRKR